MTTGITEGGVIVCSECGCVHDAGTDLLKQARGDLARAERDLRAKRAQIGALVAQQDEALTASPQYPNAMKVLNLWRELCMPNARELTGKDRLAHVIARLKGSYSLEQLMECVRGYSRFPYVTRAGRASAGYPAEWQADAELIFRSPKHVDIGLRLAKAQAMYPPESLMYVPWREARAANRRAIVHWLMEHFGAGEPHGSDDKILSWPCFKCDGRLFVNRPDTDSSSLALCNRCGVSDVELLGMAQTGADPPDPQTTLDVAA